MMTTKPKPACDRCVVQPGEYTWRPVGPPSKLIGEFRLCALCVQALKSCLENKRRRAPAPVSDRPDRKSAEQFESPGPPPNPPRPEPPPVAISAADEKPIRRLDPGMKDVS